MRRIGLFLGVEPYAGGMFQYAQSMLEALRAFPQGYEIHVACATPTWAPLLGNYPFKVTHLRGGKWGLKLAAGAMVFRLPRWLTARFNPLAAQLKRLQADLWIFPAQDAISYQLGVPFVATIHDLMHRYEPHFPEVSGWLRHSLRELRFKNIAKKATAILVDSEVGRQHVAESYDAPADKIFPLPYIPPRYILEAHEPADFATRYPLPKKFFFYPAQFWAHKNHRALLEAAEALKPTLPDLHLVFAGGLRHAYEELSKEIDNRGLRDHVTFVGYVPDEYLAGFYRRARALLMPTYFGPTNIPPLEALACGCPMAVSRIYAMPEQLGDAAVYFDPKSVSEIRQGMQRLWQDDILCEQLRGNGRERLALWGQAEFNTAVISVVQTLYAKLRK